MPNVAQLIGPTKLPPDTYRKKHFLEDQWCSVCGPGPAAVPGNWLDMLTRRPCPKPAESEPLEWAQQSV